jgi:hypothetical protein
MRHLIYVATGMPSGISGAIREIQPHQYLIGSFRQSFPASTGAEAVDAANRALYKTGIGGGRNPAAAVL